MRFKMIILAFALFSTQAHLSINKPSQIPECPSVTAIKSFTPDIFQDATWGFMAHIHNNFGSNFEWTFALFLSDAVDSHDAKEKASNSLTDLSFSGKYQREDDQGTSLICVYAAGNYYASAVLANAHFGLSAPK